MAHVEFSDISPQARGADDAFLPREFLVLGGEPISPPGIRFQTNPSHPYAAIILAGPVDAAAVSDVLDRGRDPAAPIADFGGNRGLRRDFVGETLDAASLAAMQKALAPIWRRLIELPFRARADERAAIAILRLAYSRVGAIEARFAPESVIEYPLLGRVTGARQRLEALAELGLLRRRHFMRTHLCGRCNSARLLAYEACPSCGGADLVEEAVVHHYRCGCQAPESRFVSDQQLICPKCRRELRHFGVDYGKPGAVVECRACGAANAEPDPRFACLDCATVTPARLAATADWHHYDLTADGLEALQTGALGRSAARPEFVAGKTRSYSPIEFQLLAAQQLLVARRARRPFAIVELAIANAEALRESHGAGSVDAAVRRMADTIGASLSEGEFLAPTGRSILIGLPETSAADATDVVERLVRIASAAAPIPVELTVTVRDGDTATELLQAS